MRAKKQQICLSGWLSVSLDDCLDASMDVGIDARLDCQKQII